METILTKREKKLQPQLMTINILLTTKLDPRCRSLRDLNQNEIQAAKNKLIKEVSGVPCTEEECTEEDNGSKRKTIKGFEYL